MSSSAYASKIGYPHDFQPTFHTTEAISKTKGHCYKGIFQQCGVRIASHARTVILHIYVGQTKRLFGVRLKEHQKAVFTGDSEKSALTEHVLKTGHTID